MSSMRLDRADDAERLRVELLECEPGWRDYLRCPCCGRQWASADARDAGTEWCGVQLDVREHVDTVIRLHLRNCSCGSTFTAVREVVRQVAPGLYPVACDLCGDALSPVGEDALAGRQLCAACAECPPTLRANYPAATPGDDGAADDSTITDEETAA
jgi:hypothetical protein